MSIEQKDDNVSEVIETTGNFERLSQDYPAFFVRGYQIGVEAVEGYEPGVRGDALSHSDEVVGKAIRVRHQGQPIEGVDLWRLSYDSDESLAISAGIFAGTLSALVVRATTLRETQS